MKSRKAKNVGPIIPRAVVAEDSPNTVLGEKLRLALVEHALRDDTLIARGSWMK